MNKKVLTAEQYNKMMSKAKTKEKAKAKFKAQFKNIIKHKKINLSNETKCKIVTAIGAVVIASAVALGGTFIGKYVYKTYKSYVEPQPERVYTQDDFVPAGYFNDHPIVIAVSNDFSNNEYKKIKNAINTLDNYAEGIKFETVRTSKTERKDGEQIIILKDTEGILEKKDGNVVGLALTSKKEKTKPEDYCGKIYLQDENSFKGYQFEETTMHEILHFLGFKNENDYKSIMYFGTGLLKNKPTKKDIENINTKFPAAEQEQ